jgi:putative ABC transport system permease protein
MLEQALGSNLRTALRVLWGVVTAVLLMACANVANLSLARAVTRRKEIAVRLALGASRRRVIRQLLVESLGIALLGCVLGVVLGYGALRLIIVASPPNIPRLDQVTLDGEVLAFTFGISLVTGLLFGLAPAWQGTRLPLHDTLKASGRGASAARAMARSRNILVMGEVALSLVLLVAAGLMLQSFLRMLQAERGFRPDHLLTAELDFSVSGFTTWARPTEKRPQVPLQEVMERLRARPGILAVGAGSTLVSTADRPASQPFILWGRPDPAPGQPRVANFKGISPGWIQAMGARIVRGRDFDESDTLQSSGVAIINESLARRYFPNEDPIGKHLSMDASQSSLTARDTFGIPYWSEIVGVVADIQSLDARPQTVPEVYRPSWQWPMQSPTVLVRFTGDPVSVVNAVRREVRDVLPS